jgi:two-component system nitrate/nitrite response regulator NarL
MTNEYKLAFILLAKAQKAPVSQSGIRAMNKSCRRLSVLVADDHPVVLQGIVGVLRSQADINVVSICRDGVAALKAIREVAPDIALLDISMPGLNGIEILTAADGCATKIVLLTALATDEQILTAVARGAKGLLLKDGAINDLVHCLHEVAAGRPWLPQDLLDAALERETGRRVISDRLEKSLTTREQQVMLAVSEGLSNKEVGRQLDLSEGTVKIHLHNIYQKVSVANRTALAALAIAHRNHLRNSLAPAN